MSQENNFIPNQKPYCNLRPFPLFMKNNFPFIENTYESLDIYGLLCKVVEYLNNVINNENIVTENQQALYDAFVELNNYVSHYFDNLDVQEEINNKLDEMVESGVLPEIVADYLNSKAIFAFDNVNAMINSENLINGSYAKTLGYYEINDGGSALYKIRNRTFDDTIDNASIILMSNENLVAELIIENSTLTIEQVGGKKDDNTFDNSSYIYLGLNLIQKINGGTLLFNSGIYECKTPIVIDFDIYSTTLSGTHGVLNQNKGSMLNYSGTNFLFNFNMRCNNFYIENIGIICNNNSFASFNLTFHKSRIKNVSVKNAIKGLLFNTGTYSKIDNYTYLSDDSNSEYGIQIGSEQEHYTTEYFYIINSSIDFQNASQGTCLKVLKMEGGLWCEHNDFCATLGTAVHLANELSGSSNYYNFDNNNISGCKYGFYFDAKVGNIGGVYLNNQRISINSLSTDERFIYATKSSYYNTDLHIKNIYLRRKNASVVPTYLYEITTNSCSSDSEITFDNGEKFNSPIYCNADVKSIYDFRNKYALILNNNYITSTGDVSVPMSEYPTLIKGPNFTKKQTAVINSDKNYYMVAVNYSNDGVPLVVIRVGEVTTSRVNIMLSKEFEYSINP